MDKLWAPWRINYITAKKHKNCLFCEANKSPKKNCVILKTKHSIAMLNIYPYNNGHLMVAPIRHVRDIVDLKEAEATDLFQTMVNARGLLKIVLKPQGYNIGMNISKSAGAGIDGHIHIHIVPRWVGDTNFMPTLFSTKVISQSLNELYKRLIHARSKTD
jgi:ATP adenylyltransferase